MKDGYIIDLLVPYRVSAVYYKQLLEKEASQQRSFLCFIPFPLCRTGFYIFPQTLRPIYDYLNFSLPYSSVLISFIKYLLVIKQEVELKTD